MWLNLLMDDHHFTYITKLEIMNTGINHCKMVVIEKHGKYSTLDFVPRC